MLHMLKYIPGAQEVHDEAVLMKPLLLVYVPDHFKTQEMRLKAVEAGPWWLRDVSDHFKTQEMCIKAVAHNPCMLKYVPDHFKTQTMCNKVVVENPLNLNFVLDWFVAQQQVKIWHDYCDSDRLIKWYDGYKKSNTQKAKIEEELMPIAWHPSRWWGN